MALLFGSSRGSGYKPAESLPMGPSQKSLESPEILIEDRLQRGLGADRASMCPRWWETCEQIYRLES